MKESLNVEGLRPVDIVNEKEDTEVKSKLLGLGSYRAKFLSYTYGPWNILYVKYMVVQHYWYAKIRD